MSRLLIGLVLALLSARPASAQLTADTFIAGGLDFPVGFVQDPANANVQFVIEQTGRIRVIQAGTLLATPFLDLSGSIGCCGERGLLGLAFPPDAAVSRRFYVNFTNPAGHTVIARFVRTANPLVADPASRFDLRWGSPTGPRFIEQPFANHNGGSLNFGPDGYLYIAMGDGGSGNDPLRVAQDPESLLGKMLRIDVSVSDAHAQGYVVPPDNPFVGQSPTLPEIWAFGLRNPWKFSFDNRPGGTGAMLVADVGQSNWEEVNYEPAGRGGRNYGWVLREGAHDTGIGPPDPGAPATLTDPIFEYDHSSGRSITGGYVYRGTALGGMFSGRYFFGDFSDGRVWSVALTVDPGTGEATAAGLQEHTAQLSGGGSSVGLISSFGQDSQGNLYIVLWLGSILRIRATGATVMLTPDQSSPQATGTTITWTATPDGPITPPYQYKWWVHDGNAWGLAVDWTSSDTFAWTPMASANYYVGVWVKSAGNPADAAEVPHSVPFTINGPPAIDVTLNADRASPQPTGTTITWTASPSGGTSPYQYKWWVHDGATWTMATGWVASSSFAWTPTTANASYTVRVWVRSTGSTADLPEGAATQAYAITAAPRVSAVTLTANRTSPQAAGTTITWTAAPTGGTAPYQYKWWVYDGTAWAMAVDWTTTNTFAWTPNTSGDYYVGVWVRSHGNSANAAEVPHSVPFSITGASAGPVTSVQLTANRTSPQAAGTTITWMATPTGGTAPHQYKWWVFSNGAWAVAVDWTTTNTFAWTPNASGNYYVGVWVRSAGNAADAAEVPHSVPFTISGSASSGPVTSVQLTPDRASPQAPGTTITWTAAPTGGVAPHQYKWWIFSNGAWAVAVDWTTNNSFAWTPAATGDYYIGVWVKSAGNGANAAEVPHSVPFAIR